MLTACAAALCVASSSVATAAPEARPDVAAESNTEDALADAAEKRADAHAASVNANNESADSDEAPADADKAPAADETPAATDDESAETDEAPAEVDEAPADADADEAPADADADEAPADADDESADADDESADADEADEADEASEDDGGASEPATPGVPERLPKLQVAGWWTLFGAFALASTAGVFSGLAERQEDKAVRLAARFDQESGSQPLYADARGEYEDILSRGRAYQNAAIGLGVVAGAVAIAALALFIVDARRGRQGDRARASLQGFRVRF